MNLKALFEFEVVENVVRPIKEIKRTVQELSAPIREVNESANRLTHTLRRIGETAKEVGEKIEKTFKKVKDVSRDVAELGGAITAPIAGAVWSAVEYEKVLVGEFNKVADLPKKQLQEFSDYFKQLGEEYGKLPTEVAQLAGSLAQMGIPVSKLKEYTKIVTEMAFAFDMTGEQAGEAIGKIASAFGIKENVQAIKELGDTINYLSNTLGAKASDIVGSLKYFAGTAKSFGLTASQAAVLAGALIDMGESAETAGTSLKTILLKMDPTEKGFKQLLLAVGMTSQQWYELKEKNPMEAFVILTQKIKELLKTDPKNAGRLLKEAFGIEHADRMLKLANNAEKLKQKLQEISQGKHIGSMSQEVQKLMETTAFQFSQLKVQLFNLGVEIGSILIPPLKDLLSLVSSIIKPFTEFVRQHQELVKPVLMLVAGFGAFLTVAGMIGWYIGFIGSGIGTLIEVIGGLNLQLWASENSVKIFSSAVKAATFPLRVFSVVIRTIGLVSLKSFSLALKGLSISLSLLRKTLLITSLASKSFGIAISVMTVGIRLAIGAIRGLGLAFRLLTLNPVGLLLTGLAIGAYYVYTHWEKVKNLFSSIANFLKSIFVGAIKFVKENWKSLLSVFLYLNPITAPIMAFKKLVSFLKSINLFEIGKNIIESLKNGIMSVVKKPIEAVKRVGKSIIEGAKALFHIRSPSRVFAEIGEQLNLGLFEGIKNSVGVLSKAVEVFKNVIPKDIKIVPEIVPGISKVFGIPLTTAVSLAATMPAKTEILKQYTQKEITRIKESSHNFSFNVNVYIQNLTATKPHEVATQVATITEAEIRRMLRRIEEEKRRRTT